MIEWYDYFINFLTSYMICLICWENWNSCFHHTLLFWVKFSKDVSDLKGWQLEESGIFSPSPWIQFLLKALFPNFTQMFMLVYRWVINDATGGRKLKFQAWASYAHRKCDHLRRNKVVKSSFRDVWAKQKKKKTKEMYKHSQTQHKHFLNQIE